MDTGPPPNVRATNLTRAATPFIGRAHALAHVRSLFADGAWLVSLLGPAGMGKTRLALQVGELEHASGAWPGGVWLCELGDVRSLEEVCGAVAHAAGATLAEEAPFESLAETLRMRGKTFLVLDNCEHIVEVIGSALARWQKLAPETRWLVTSRERIRVVGEHAYELSPLSVPEGGDPTSSEAVQLFVERVGRVRTGYEPDAEELARVTELVRRLDGLPLAIELAAARAGVLPTAALIERLASRFALLSARLNGMETRQQTLRAAIDGSWELLSVEEQLVLRQCSIFRGGFTLDAAEQVVVGPRAGLLQTIEALHDKSLLRVHPTAPAGGKARLGFYDSIRDYAEERLDAAGETAQAIARHRSHFARWGLERAMLERYDGSRDAAHELTADLDNLLFAHHNAVTTPAEVRSAIDDALRLAVVLYRPLSQRQTLGTYLALISATLDHEAASSADPALLAHAYCTRATMRPHLGPLELAIADFDTASSHAARSGDAFAEATVLLHRIHVYSDAGRSEDARAGALRAQHVFEAQGHLSQVAMVRALLSFVGVRADDLDAAYTDCAAAAEYYRANGSSSLGYALGCLAAIEHMRGHLGRAGELYTEALGLLETLDFRAQRGGYRGLEAMLEFERGEYELARVKVGEAIGTLRDAGVIADRMSFVALEGAVAAVTGELEVGEQKLEDAATALALIGGAPLAVVEVLRGHADLARARAARQRRDFALAAALRTQADARLCAESPRVNTELFLARRLLAMALARDVETPAVPDVPPSPAAALVVHCKGDWFEVPGIPRVLCRRKPVVRALLAALAQRRAQAVGEPVDIEVLVLAAWPGERLDHKTAHHRLHNALGILRELGLREQLVAAGRGYLLDPAIVVRIVGV